MSEEDGAPPEVGVEAVFSAAVVRGLSDKLYEKRKQAAAEIEVQVKELFQADDQQALHKIIHGIILQFIRSQQPNSRKGGLIGLATTAVGLGSSNVEPFLPVLFPPVLKGLSDPDAHVRFFACEALYNLCKVARLKSLPFFADAFDGMCKLYADQDSLVTSAVELLDRLFKDIVTENGPDLDLGPLVEILKPRIYVIHPLVRQFLLTWIAVLHSIPGLDLLRYVPDFLDGIFIMLEDRENKEIHSLADNILGEFLRDITKGEEPYDLVRLIRIPIGHCSSKNSFTQHRALTWVSRLLNIGSEAIVPFAGAILAHTMPLLFAPNETIRKLAIDLTAQLKTLVQERAANVDVEPLLELCVARLQSLGTSALAKPKVAAPAHRPMGSPSVPNAVSDTACRHAAIEWVSMLFENVPEKVFAHMDLVFPALMHSVTDSDANVVRYALLVLSHISTHGIYFSLFVTSLLKVFNADATLLRSRATLIVRTLCTEIEPERLFRAISRKLETEVHVEFASTMVTTLNLILLTAPELRDLRALLAEPSDAQRQLFVALFQSWCHAPVAVIALSLLCGMYRFAAEIVLRFPVLETTVHLLVEIDKLIQLLESPVFLRVRMHLLESHRYPYLCQVLYGLLQCLPQSDAFHLLNNRLLCVQSLSSIQMSSGYVKVKESSKEKGKRADDLDMDVLLKHFLSVQEQHREHEKKRTEGGQRGPSTDP